MMHETAKLEDSSTTGDYLRHNYGINCHGFWREFHTCIRSRVKAITSLKLPAVVN